jgi:hypothetical protein
MRKYDFTLERYNSGDYDLITRDGRTPVIAAIDEKISRDAIIGWVDGKAESWTITGKYMDGETSGIDLFLKTKSKIMHINITLSKSGKIQCYGNLEKKPKLNQGTTLLEYFTREINA